MQQSELGTFTKIHNLQISQQNDFVGLDGSGIFTSLN